MTSVAGFSYEGFLHGWQSVLDDAGGWQIMNQWLRKRSLSARVVALGACVAGLSRFVELEEVGGNEGARVEQG